MVIGKNGVGNLFFSSSDNLKSTPLVQGWNSDGLAVKTTIFFLRNNSIE
jgi:hypothetical protein